MSGADHVSSGLGVDDGGAAFPTSAPAITEMGRRIHGAAGMTLRDYFAAKAMQGLIAHDGSAGTEHVREETRYMALDYQASTAYLLADAMLKARNA